MLITDVKFRRFRLSDSFLSRFREARPPWGPLGEFTFYKTYSRRQEGGGKEEYWETLRRVVEGMTNLQKFHCHKHSIRWDGGWAQALAQQAYELAWDFKWLPSGRGLWLMGTDFVYEHGSAGLNSCAFVSTRDMSTFPSVPFAWAMEALTLGVGVGFDVRGADTVLVHKPTLLMAETLVIPDSREGWVASVAVLLDAFLDEQGLPRFDYSGIRPKGTPLRSFGGTASGPDPLIQLHERLKELLSGYVGRTLDSEGIVDIFTLISQCVVSGNVRRSAMIALGLSDDSTFLELKLNGGRLKTNRHHANNSVIAPLGSDYTRIAELNAENGEPGVLWLENVRKYGRMIDGPTWADRRVMGVNPCFAGETLIAVADGRGAVPIKQLVDEGDDVPVYAVNSDTGRVEIKVARNPRCTRDAASLLEIGLDDGTSFRVTPDHKMLLLNGEKCEARELQPGDSLPRFDRRLEAISPGKKYLRVYCNTQDRSKNKVFEHRLIAQFHFPQMWGCLYDEGKQNGWVRGGLVIHHRDFDRTNNRPDNLAIMSFRDYASFHSSLSYTGEDNPMWGQKHSEETKRKIGERTRERCADPVFLAKVARAHTQEERDRAAVRLSAQRKAELLAYYQEQAEKTDLDFVWVGERLYAVRVCETCGEQFVTPWAKRGRSFCSISCSNKKEASVKCRRVGQATAFADKLRRTFHAQVHIYQELVSQLGRPPLKAEWEERCREMSVPFRFRTQDSTKNPFALRGYKHLQEVAATYNHKVKYIRSVTSLEPVYNLSVDDYHTVGIITKHQEGGSSSGVFVFQCGEQALEDRELCNLVETFPARHATREEYLETLKIAHLYGKCVTLLDTHWPTTNLVMRRNMRMGISQSGIVQALERHGHEEMRRWCDDGYAYLRECDRKLSEFMRVAESIKLTSVKPSGTVSLLPGATPGVHYPHAEYYVRRQRISNTHPLLAAAQAAGYPVEPDVVNPETTSVISFFVREAEWFGRTKDEVSMWEQFCNAAMWQKHWADNQVSITVTFRPEERVEIPMALTHFEDQLKCVSLLPLSDAAYEQMPYEAISASEYERATKDIHMIDYSMDESEAVGEKFCDSESCSIE